MDLIDIKNFGKFINKSQDCVLFLWVTDPMIPQGLEVMKSWGFMFKTVGFYWAKTGIDGEKFPMGIGYYTRANPEQCLLGTIGKPKVIDRGVSRLIVSPRREHSRKPDETYDRIERLFPGGMYLEIFARQPSGFRSGWDTIGNQTEPGDRRWPSAGGEAVARVPDSEAASAQHEASHSCGLALNEESAPQDAYARAMHDLGRRHKDDPGEEPAS